MAGVVCIKMCSKPGGTGLWSAMIIGTTILDTTTCHWPDMDQHQQGMWLTNTVTDQTATLQLSLNPSKVKHF